MRKLFFYIISFSFVLSNAQTNFVTIPNPNGQTLGYSPNSGVKILTINGLKFKDLNRNGKLDKYEDWRLSAEERAKDLASKMTVEQIAGLMLYSSHQAIPAMESSRWAGTYNGLPFSKSGVGDDALTDQQKKFVLDDNLRHVLITTVSSPVSAAKWNNNLQALAEGTGLGIPCNTSSDPRHTALTTQEYDAGAGGKISLWPDGLAMAATFDPQLTYQFGQIAAKEYRALGIATALSPQVDLGTEPRWIRIANTFGEDPQLATDMTKAYIDGFQTSKGKDEIQNGWGYSSVNAMVKHWPGGGPEEGGRDAHFAYGKFAVYPGNSFETQLTPFVNGAFKLDGSTKMAAAVMPYYTISYNQDVKNGENVGNSFSKYIITDLLRNKYNYKGVVCTDWMITADEGNTPSKFVGKCWGMEAKTIAERHYKALVAGVDQFGGNNDKMPVLEAYKMGVKEYGKNQMRKRFELSAERLLTNIFRVGLFENPYLDPKETESIVGNPEFMKAGYNAQLKSVVLLKNKKHILPIEKNKTVYIPKMYAAPVRNWFAGYSQPKIDYPVNIEQIKKYYNVTDDPQKADFAIVFVSSPHSNDAGYSDVDRANGGNGYVPITLQYGTYTAVDAPEHSIAAGDPVIDPSIKDRSYKNKTTTANNISDLTTILNTKEQMNGKPVVVVVTASKPMIFSEFEKQVDGIVLNFNVSSQAVMDIVSGKTEPSGLLPVQMPANMKTVEEQKEDVPRDMKCHIDSEGNIYDFGYGLNWSGVIHDARTQKYKINNLINFNKHENI